MDNHWLFPFFVRILYFGGLLSLCVLDAQIINAQASAKPKPVQAGYQFRIQYNLYNRFSHRPKLQKASVSSGQVLNVVPGIGGGFWLSQPHKWWLSVHANIEYSPLALDFEQKIGLGTLNIPVGIECKLPLTRQKSLWTFMHFGFGTELFYSAIYQKNAFNNLHQSLYAELGVHLAAVGLIKKQKKDLSFYFRYGIGWEGERSLNIGLRLQFWHWFKQR